MNKKEEDIYTQTKSNSGIITTSVIGVGILGFALSRYKTSRSNEWLVRTVLQVQEKP